MSRKTGVKRCVLCSGYSAIILLENEQVDEVKEADEYGYHNSNLTNLQIHWCNDDSTLQSDDCEERKRIKAHDAMARLLLGGKRHTYYSSSHHSPSTARKKNNTNSNNTTKTHEFQLPGNKIDLDP